VICSSITFYAEIQVHTCTSTSQASLYSLFIHLYQEMDVCREIREPTWNPASFARFPTVTSALRSGEGRRHCHCESDLT
jgi:hypothetical protein